MKHGPNTWENYLKVHERVLRDFSGNITTSDPQYKVKYITDNYYILELNRLEVLTLKGTKIFIKIEKDIYIKEGVRKKVAKLYAYSYHSWFKETNKNILRYCSPHEDHNKFHHRHDYTHDPMRTIKINEDEWPHVSEFLEEIIKNF